MHLLVMLILFTFCSIRALKNPASAVLEKSGDIAKSVHKIYITCCVANTVITKFTKNTRQVQKTKMLSMGLLKTIFKIGLRQSSSKVFAKKA
jgi:hypothetical protein